MRTTLMAVLLGSTLLAQDALPLPANLRTEGLPPLPQSLMQDLARYGEGRGAGVLDWNKTNNSLLITTRFGEVNQLHLVAMPMGARTQLTFGQERISSGTFEPTRGDYLVYSQDVGGGEFFQLFRLDLGSRKTTLLTDGKSRNTSPLFSRDGRSLAFASTRRNGTDTDLWIMDPLQPGGARQVLEVQGGGWAPSAWSPDGRSLLVSRYLRATESELYLLDLSTGKKERISPEGQAAWGDGVFTGDGQGLYLSTDQGSEFRRLAHLDLRTRRISFLRPEIPWSIEQLELSRDGRFLAYLANEAGVSVLRIMDTRTRKDLPLPRLPKGSVGSMSWRADSRELAFTLSSAQSPSDAFSIRIADGKLLRWTCSEVGPVDPTAFVEPELVHWKAKDGLDLSGFLYRPARKAFSGPRPVIIEIHGGPEGQSRPGYLGRLNYLVNELGCALIFPNVRGSDGYGKTFLDLDNGLKREDSVQDIGALLDWIDGQPDLDRHRIMVTGGSYGGYMTLAAMTHFNDRLRCGLDVVGISNFVTFLKNTQGYRRDLRRVEYGDERDPEMRAFLTRISPATQAAKITKPMFIVQGKNDPRVPVTEATQMVEQIRRNHGPVWYLEAADEGHGFAKKKNRDIQFAAEVLFIQNHLLK
ncbi:MAG: tolB [Holophagaceae bacterium]|nr:tolB [Holophagaceae bacterium]